ncbi:MAG: ParB/RepB/Spo0J family partition protein [Phycisphaerae bacterium]
MASETKPNHRARLGRGLSSLITNSAQPIAADPTYQSVAAPQAISPARSALELPKPDGRPQEIPAADIAANPYQPRRHFNEDELSELAASITQQGILQPLIVAVSKGDGLPYVLIAGERRLRAARKAGLATVPCVIRQASPQQMLEWALVENIQRSDLGPVEKAQAYQDYMLRFSLTQLEVSQRLGQSRATVANYLRILELPDEVRFLIQEGNLSFGHAKLLASLTSDPAKQFALANRCAGEELSVRQLEGLLTGAEAEAQVSVGGGGPARPDRRKTKAPYILDLEERLTRSLGTRVLIQPGRAKNTGRISVDYYSLDDFDRIGAALGLTGDA